MLFLNYYTSSSKGIFNVYGKKVKPYTVANPDNVKIIIIFIPYCKQNPITIFTKVVEIDAIAQTKPRHIPLAFVGKISSWYKVSIVE